MPIFFGVRWWGGVKWECGRREFEFSLSIAISSGWSFPLVLHVEIYTASRGFLATEWLLYVTGVEKLREVVTNCILTKAVNTLKTIGVLICLYFSLRTFWPPVVLSCPRDRRDIRYRGLVECLPQCVLQRGVYVVRTRFLSRTAATAAARNDYIRNRGPGSISRGERVPAGIPVTSFRSILIINQVEGVVAGGFCKLIYPGMRILRCIDGETLII